MLSGTALAFLATPIDLKYDAAQADVIFAGKVLQSVPITSAVGSTVRGSTIVTFRVGRVIKGEIEAGYTITVHYPSVYKDIPERFSGYDLVLLRKNGESYTFAKPPFIPLQVSEVPVSEVSYTPYVPSSNVDDNLRWEILNSLKSPNKNIVKAALNQVSVLSENDVAVSVKPLTEHKDPAIQVAAIAALAWTIDIQPALHYLESHPDLDLATSNGREIDFALVNAIPKIADLYEIVELLKSKSDIRRERASYLLRLLGDKAAVPYLKSALDDTDVKVRYNSVMGLALIVIDRTGHAPTYDLFLANEQYYIKYWKTKTMP